MGYTYQDSRIGWGICILTMLFIFAPVLSTQADAHPGALYVVVLVLPIFILASKIGIIKSKSINIYAFLLFVFALFSALISDYGDFNFRTILKFLFFILFFISTSSFVLTPKQLKFAFKSYLYLSIAISILIVLSFIFGYPHIESYAYQGRYSIGITGLFKNPNYLSSFYNVAFFVISYMLVTLNIKTNNKFIFYSLLALFVVATFFTGTRAALVIEAVIILIMLARTMKKGQVYKLIPLFIVVAIVVAYYWSTIMDLYNLFAAGREMTHDTIREDSWNYALEFIKKNPIFGSGHNSWSVIHQMRGDVDEYLHNIFLELLLDQGLIGCLLVFLIVTVGFNKTKKGDRFFLVLLLFTTAFPMLFQNGLYEINFWRFIIVNRLMMNISIYYEDGINGILKYIYSDILKQ